MPRDLHRLAAPAVFRNSVSRSYRRRSPPFRRRSPRRNVSRQRERLLDERECEYDDYAAEIASYNRLRRGDQFAANSAPSTSRCTYETCHSDSADIITPQSDSRYCVSHVDTNYRLHAGVPTYHSNAAYVSGDSIHHGISRLYNSDSQQRKHKKKRRHHHCHSRNKASKHGENGSGHQRPRDTIAALKALADYDDANQYISSISSGYRYDNSEISQWKESCERISPVAHCNVADDALKVTVNANLSSPPAECSKDDLSLGERSDDDEDVHAMQTSVKPVSSHSSPHVDYSSQSVKPSSIPDAVPTAVSPSESTKKAYSESTPCINEESSAHIHPSSDSSSNPKAATSSAENKADKTELAPVIKHDRSSSDCNDSQSAVCLKRSPDTKQTSAVDGGCNTISDEKRDTKCKILSSRSTRNYRKKSSTDDDQPTATDDTPLPRFVTYFCQRSDR